jgi:cytochrome c-type biogenesis protein CcmF
MTCGLLLLAAGLAMPVGFTLAWKRGDLLGAIQRLTVAIAAGGITAIVCVAWLRAVSILASVAAGLAIFIIIGSLIEVAMRAWRPGLAAGVALRRVVGLPLSFWGSALAHMGVGLTLLGLAGVGFGSETITTLHKGMAAEVGPYAIKLDSVAERVGPNYKETVTAMTVRSGGSVVATIEPTRRQFAARRMATTEAGLATLHFGQIYVSIADPTPEGDVPARLYWKPLVTFIWLGGCAMALGGALSLADRRLRFGVAVRARAGAAIAAAE